MSETWTSLLAALVGAIVGGAASLAGTMVVNKQQMATNARMQLYYELLPHLASAMDSAIDPQVPEDQVAEEVMPEILAKVRRTSVIAGPFERKAVHNLEFLWTEHQNAPRREISMDLPKAVNADPPDPPGTERPPLTGSASAREDTGRDTGSLGPSRSEARVRDAPDVEPLDYAEAAQRWRKRAEVLWKVCRFLDDLSVRYRNAAAWCDLQGDACDLAAEQRSPSPPDDQPG